MHTFITTASGTRYVITPDGIVTRQGDHDILGLPGWDGARLVTTLPIEVGAAWRFRTADGPIITSPVVSITVDMLAM